MRDFWYIIFLLLARAFAESLASMFKTFALKVALCVQIIDLIKFHYAFDQINVLYIKFKFLALNSVNGKKVPPISKFHYFDKLVTVNNQNDFS